MVNVLILNGFSELLQHPFKVACDKSGRVPRVTPRLLLERNGKVADCYKAFQPPCKKYSYSQFVISFKPGINLPGCLERSYARNRVHRRAVIEWKKYGVNARQKRCKPRGE